MAEVAAAGAKVQGSARAGASSLYDGLTKVVRPSRFWGYFDKPWDRRLYLVLLLVAMIVILYSLVGIAALWV